MIRSVLFFVLTFPLVATAQFSYVIDQSVPVSDTEGNKLDLAWAGGLNSTQYNSMDLDFDGDDDLVLFDRTANKAATFLNKNNNYVYAPDYEELFPEEITNWILLRDFNCDGLKDIFTSDIFGIRVFINKSTAGNIQWEKFLFYTGTGAKSEVVLTKGFTSKINLQIQYDDLPSIEDMDGDGDLDILSLRFPSGGTIEYHKNFSKERYGSCDSLDFERITQTWGEFTECTCGNYAFNGTDCPIGGRTKHAGGKTLLALNVDGDGDKDLLLSEASCTQIFLLRNTGASSENALMTSSSSFPQSIPAHFQVYPAAFYEDVDFDGTKDLMLSSNIYANDFPNSIPNLQQSNWFYKNTGTNTQPSFTFVKRNFLQDEMIDVGDNAMPAFADYDADGDLDMFVSQLTSQNILASIALYENIGTSSEPEFKLQTTDYINFSSLNLFNVKIQWVDLNGDARIDLAFSGTSFQTGLTSMFFIPNQSSGVFDFGGQVEIPTNFNISRSENAYFTDVNNDGSMDILVGKTNGALEYWRNTGLPGTFNFSLEDESFVGLDVSVLRQNPRVVAADMDADGFEDLVIGDQSGQLQIVGNFREAGDDEPSATDIIYNDILKTYTSPNFGGRILPEVANLFNSDKPAIIIGTIMGGLHLLKPDDGQSLPDNPVVRVYPVPIERSQILHIRVDRTSIMEIYSSLGQRVSSPVVFGANVVNNFPVQALSRGVYILRFTSNNKSTTRRIVIY